MMLFCIIGILIILLSVLFYSYKNQVSKFNNSRQNLERVVEERTAALKQKEQEVTDSIRYALRIQLSIIPTAERVKTLLPKSMIFYRPKDIVSGDFYWVEEIDGEVLFAAVDCTGHGVPGAMMSVVGLKILTQAVQDNKLSHPSDILQYLDVAVNDTLRQSVDSTAVKDGMDLALCNINFKTKTLKYAGVFNSLWVLRKNISSTYVLKSSKEMFYGEHLLEIKADKYYIGNNSNGVADVYDTHLFQLQDDDCVYIYTDGYADQFGGPLGKKFKYKQLKDLLVSNFHLSMEEQHRTIKNAFDVWKGKQEQVDDVLIIGIKI